MHVVSICHDLTATFKLHFITRFHPQHLLTDKQILQLRRVSFPPITAPGRTAEPPAGARVSQRNKSSLLAVEEIQAELLPDVQALFHRVCDRVPRLRAPIISFNPHFFPPSARQKRNDGKQMSRLHGDAPQELLPLC